MRQDEWGRNGPVECDQRRRGVARVVPLPDESNDESLALVVLVVSASIAIVASTLAAILF
jgi:hypothetical protein